MVTPCPVSGTLLLISWESMLPTEVTYSSVSCVVVSTVSWTWSYMVWNISLIWLKSAFQSCCLWAASHLCPDLLLQGLHPSRDLAATSQLPCWLAFPQQLHVVHLEPHGWPSGALSSRTSCACFASPCVLLEARLGTLQVNVLMVLEHLPVMDVADGEFQMCLSCIPMLLRHQGNFDVPLEIFHWGEQELIFQEGPQHAETCLGPMVVNKTSTYWPVVHIYLVVKQPGSRWWVELDCYDQSLIKT